MFFGKKKSIDTQVYRFVDGDVMDLGHVNDQVFAQKMMGDGIAILPTSQTILAPCDGVVSVVFPTGHAYGITRADGVEILIHLGIDTVELDGEGFTQKVKQGDTVKRGDILGYADWDLIASKGKEISSMLIVTSGQTLEHMNSYEDVMFKVKA